MDLSDYFTFGRPQGTAIAIFLQTVPIFFALLTGSPPVIRWPFDDRLAILVTALMAIILFYTLYRTIDSISKSVLSIEMQKERNKLISAGIYSVIGLSSALIAYFLFIFPVNVQVTTGLDDYTTGIALGLLYSEYIAVPQAVRIKALVDTERRERTINSFLNQIEELRVGSGDELEGVSKSVKDLGGEIIIELEKEPISGKGSLKAELENWLQDLDSAQNLPQEKKLVNMEEDNRIKYITNNLSILS